MSAADAGRFAVWTVIVWTILSVIFAVFVWPHLARMMDEQRRRQIVQRQQKAYDKAVRTIVEEEIAKEATRIIRMLDDQDTAFLLDFEYRREADGKRIA